MIRIASLRLHRTTLKETNRWDEFLAVVIWVITIALGLDVFQQAWWFPEAITDHGPAVDRQFLITIIVCGIAFTAAQIGLGWVVWKYRDSPTKQRATYSHGSNRLEVVWTVVTAVVFISLAVMGQRVWASLHLNPAPAGVILKSKLSRNSFPGTFTTPARTKYSAAPIRNYIDDATNPVGLGRHRCQRQRRHRNADVGYSRRIVPSNLS